MGMVKRVVYIPTWGGCRDPEAVSESRNKTGPLGDLGLHDSDPSKTNGSGAIIIGILQFAS